MAPRVVSTPRTRPPSMRNPRHLAVLDQVDPPRIGAAGEAPSDGVVPRRAAASVQQSPEDRKARVLEVQERPSRPHLVARQQLRIIPLQPHRVAPPCEGVELPVGMAEVEHAPLRHHHVVVQLLLQPFPELQRMRIELRVAAEQIVRPHDRGVAPDVAAAEIAALQHRDVPDPVIAREIVGGRQPVPAAADHHDVVGRLRRRLAPHRRPAPVAAQRIAHDRPGGIPHRTGLPRPAAREKRLCVRDARGSQPTASGPGNRRAPPSAAAARKPQAAARPTSTSTSVSRIASAGSPAAKPAPAGTAAASAPGCPPARPARARPRTRARPRAGAAVPGPGSAPPAAAAPRSRAARRRRPPAPPRARPAGRRRAWPPRRRAAHRGPRPSASAPDPAPARRSGPAPRPSRSPPPRVPPAPAPAAPGAAAPPAPRARRAPPVRSGRSGAAASRPLPADRRAAPAPAPAGRCRAPPGRWRRRPAPAPRASPPTASARRRWSSAPESATTAKPRVASRAASCPTASRRLQKTSAARASCSRKQIDDRSLAVPRRHCHRLQRHAGRRAEIDPERIDLQPPRQRLRLQTYGCREHQRLPPRRQRPQHRLEVVAEVRVQHVVRLVEHDAADRRRDQPALAQMIAEPSRRPDHQVEPAVQRRPLRPEVRAAGAAADAHPGATEEPAELVAHLPRQLPRRHHHQRPRRLRDPALEQPPPQRQPVGDGLARPGRRRDQQIRMRRLDAQHRALHRRQPPVAARGKASCERLRQAPLTGNHPLVSRNSDPAPPHREPSCGPGTGGPQAQATPNMRAGAGNLPAPELGSIARATFRSVNGPTPYAQDQRQRNPPGQHPRARRRPLGRGQDRARQARQGRRLRPGRAEEPAQRHQAQRALPLRRQGRARPPRPEGPAVPLRAGRHAGVHGLARPTSRSSSPPTSSASAVRSCRTA